MHKYLLVGVFLIALCLRVIDLPHHPAGFTPDEASFGYDAYSLLQTGKDQWGTVYPMVFKSFGDYKMPLYTYLAMPSVALFGLTPFATRLPSAIIGAFAVLVVYFLIREIPFEISKNRKNVALLGSLFLALSPWHLPLSRGAFEANLTVLFLPLGILLFLKGIKRPWFLVFSAVVFGINLFTYHSARLITPLVGLFLLWEYRAQLKPHMKKTPLVLAAIVSVIVFIVSIYSFKVGAGVRLTNSSIFALGSQAGDERYLYIQYGMPTALGYFFYNKYLFVIERFFSNYLSYFSPQFLFTQGPIEGTYGMMNGLGVIYVFDAIFIIAFIVWYIRSHRRPTWLFFWLFVAPIPAALSIGTGAAANRAAVILPAIQICAAFGAAYFLHYFYKYFTKKQVIGGFLVLQFFASFSFFIHYWYVQPIKEARAMIYGQEELYSKINQYANGRPVIISKKISEPHIFAAFYNKIDPTEYQKASAQWSFEGTDFTWVDQLPVYKLNKFTFKTIDWVADLDRASTLVVGLPNEFPPSTKADFVVFSTAGDKAYIGVSSIH